MTETDTNVTAQPEEAGAPAPAWTWGLGRRKRAVARVRMRPGEGKFEVNKRDVDEYFVRESDRLAVRAPLSVVEAAGQWDVYVNCSGGGVTGQAGAVSLGLARALVKVKPDAVNALREAGLLTRDARKVERKKPGRPGARKGFQFSKR